MMNPAPVESINSTPFCEGKGCNGHLPPHYLQLESRGMDVVGIYHSHPAGPAVPSETDLRETTWREAVSLIWSPGREDWQLRAFRVDSGGWREVIMTVME